MRRGWVVTIAGVALLSFLVSCAQGRPAAFTIEAVREEPCPEGASSATSCYLIDVQNHGGTVGRATCSLSQYRKGVPGPTASGETVITSEVEPGDTAQVHLAMEWEPKKGFTRPSPSCSPGIPTDYN